MCQFCDEITEYVISKICATALRAVEPSAIAEGSVHSYSVGSFTKATRAPT